MDTRAHMAMIPPEEWSILPGYTFCVGEVAEASGMEELTVESVLDAFALPLPKRTGPFARSMTST
jgi:hypothetical protein